ncbi:hypothetical protein, variant 2 [Aphanomyces invadans]|uniref:Pyrroline-5-carboxylate reductase catalytic N-terminal domain-containing protein n=1 Tax=Aphanomyces invadans TaxID=157072 RepID=A0A024TZV6_9STRA|nr:hypothetical protein, variant 2 [Aphanomyces invadans]ETV99181.1 hypothetical protein, variant 2 [Aphanomyces invadans]|eukprot:XP_008871737.1 hypothetical protein, variant 2 [Aphanomyces invadans]
MATSLENGLVLGLLGTGKIGSAVMSGYCTPVADKSTWVPKHIFVSPRGTEKAKALHARFPNHVTIASSNQAVIDHSNIIFISLLPDVARQELPLLNFPQHVTIVSMMATIPYQELLDLLRLPRSQVVRTIPLPSSSRRTGPILAYPPHPLVRELLQQIGTPVMVNEESEVTTLVRPDRETRSRSLILASEDWDDGHDQFLLCHVWHVATMVCPKRRRYVQPPCSRRD